MTPEETKRPEPYGEDRAWSRYCAERVEDLYKECADLSAKSPQVHRQRRFKELYRDWQHAAIIKWDTEQSIKRRRQE